MTRLTLAALVTLVAVMIVGFSAPGLIIFGIVLARWAVWAVAIFSLVYFATRLAIRHERRMSS